MTAELSRRLLDRFGPGGLRRPTAADLAATALPAEAAGLLADCGLPLRVGPYFATSADDAPALADFAAQRGLPAPTGGEDPWARLGTDRGAELCVDPAGRVWAVFLAFRERPIPVNSSLAAFLDSLAELDDVLRRLAAAEQPQEVFGLFGSVESRLRATDLRAFESDENWWPRVLEDVRHTRGVPGYAAFKYRDRQGGEQILTADGSLALHPEEALWQRLAEGGARPEGVLEVYTELQACFMPGHYCSVWMAETFRQAEFTHSFDYGDTAAEREAGIRELAEALTARNG
ncbi:SUKH-4 family immunity protein [Kitasatospora sp. NA04385]|uniref:nucleic acid/nucleotide deaminase domain-containing protein n=1 Tax=Kitasatospora sp. NA04385 TaxID=2742135 RepID=UPI00159139E8|nr:nucleic acid/nucleotide deaminase domain-containing protein [Kitasatospora sp. NA04385]QKW20701.1 SUKH-4 family immunity protein [Kitasatospora sp. NA04385]